MIALGARLNRAPCLTFLDGFWVARRAYAEILSVHGSDLDDLIMNAQPKADGSYDPTVRQAAWVVASHLLGGRPTAVKKAARSIVMARTSYQPNRTADT
jgi:hypothetical protein